MRQQLLEQLLGDNLRFGRNFVSALGHEFRAVDGAGDRHLDDDTIFPGFFLDDAAIDANRVATHWFDFADVSEADCRHAVCGHIPIAHFQIPSRCPIWAGEHSNANRESVSIDFSAAAQRTYVPTLEHVLQDPSFVGFPDSIRTKTEWRNCNASQNPALAQIVIETDASDCEVSA